MMGSLVIGRKALLERPGTAETAQDVQVGQSAVCPSHRQKHRAQAIVSEEHQGFSGKVLSNKHRIRLKRLEAAQKDSESLQVQPLLYIREAHRVRGKKLGSQSFRMTKKATGVMDSDTGMKDTRP